MTLTSKAVRETAPAATPTSLFIPILVHAESETESIRSPQPITLGVPLPRGRCLDGQSLALVDDSNATIPLQQQVLSRWVDGSAQWMLLDFIVADSQACRFRLERFDTPPAPVSMIVREERTIRIDTGAMTASIDRRTGDLSGIVTAGQQRLGPRGCQLLVANAKFRYGEPRVESVDIEADGPVRATLRIRGVIAGLDPVRFTQRLSFYRGTGLVRMQTTLHNPNRARHSGGLWDLGDPGSILLKDWSLQLFPASGVREAYLTAGGDEKRRRSNDGCKLTQFSSGGERWAHRNHVNRAGAVPFKVRGYSAEVGAERFAGLRAEPVLEIIANDGWRVAAAIPEFWQQFPKSAAADRQSLSLGLFPASGADEYELQAGEQKTHVAWWDFAPSDNEPATSLAWVHRPLIATPAPEAIADSQAIPMMTPRSSHTRPESIELVERAVRGVDSFAAKREAIDEFGWRHFGDLVADHENEYFAGEKPVVSHYNNQYDAIGSLLIEGWRTGDPAWRRLAEPLARHVVDIDIYRTDCDKPAYANGMFWHTAHYVEAGTATHRCYSRRNLGSQGPAFGGGPSSEHNYSTGLLYSYFLTGDPAYRETVLGLAGWVRDAERGTGDLWSLFDDGPSGWGTFTRDWNGPGRGAGNSVNALLDAWLLDPAGDWLALAESLIRLCVHPHDDIAAMTLTDAENRWSYVVFLQVLVRYLRLKATANQYDEAYEYSRQTLLAYARWMAANERPFLDRREELEYPTETWAAQDLRKANVLLAARAFTTNEEETSRWRSKAGEWIERSYRDLASFPNTSTSRPLAIILANSSIEDYCQQHDSDPFPAPLANLQFPPRATVLSRRDRIKQALRSPKGALAILSNLLLRPQNWLAVVSRSWTAQRLRNWRSALKNFAARPLIAKRRRTRNKVRVQSLLVSQIYPPTVGGSATLLASLYSRFGAGSVEVLTQTTANSVVADARSSHAVVRRPWNFRSWAKPFELFELSLRMARTTLLRALRTGAREVHCGRSLPEGLGGLLAKWLLGRRYVTWVHGEEVATWGRYRLERLALKWILGGADCVIANSENSRRIAIAHGAKSERTKVVYPGVDLQRFANSESDGRLIVERHGLSGKRVIVTVGRLQRRKGQDMVIRALPIIRTEIPDIVYLVVGGVVGGLEGDAAELPKLARELGVEESVIFAGEVSNDDLPGYYAAADALVMPNREIDGDIEGFGMCFIEAAACGRPSIAGNSGGAVEAVLDEQTGLIVDGTRPDAIAAAVIRLLKDDDLRGRLATNAQQRARSFDWSAVFERLNS